MHRGNLQHIILEIGRRFELERFYIVGSSAILASMPEPPPGDLTATRDFDVALLDDDSRLTDQIERVLGEGSDFDDEYGYYVQGVDATTTRYAPANWRDRTIPITVEDRFTGHCMEPHDLVLSKLGAGRDKDLAFARAAARLGLVSKGLLLDRLAEIPADEAMLTLIRERVQALFPPKH